MSQLFVDNIKNRTGGAIGAPSGAVVTGIVTATGGSFSGNVSVGGVLTYEDVTNIDSVGVITARSDISIADKIIHTGDTNTAIRFPAADTFTVETGGSERLRVNSSGNIGINSTIPRSKLHVANGNSNYNPGNPTGLGAGAVASLESSGDVALQFLSSTSTDNFIYFGDTDSATTGSIQYDHNVNALSFNVSGGTERLRIDSSGRMLVGTTASPTAGNGQYSYLVIQGYPNTSAGAGHISLQRGQAAFGANNQIGLINFGDNTGASYAGIESYADAASGANDFPGRLVFSTTADGASSPTERLRVTSGGKVLSGNYFTSQQIGSYESSIQIQGTDSNTASMSIFRYTNDDGGANFTLGKGRGTSGGSVTKPNSGDAIGAIRFVIANNNNLVDGESAKIECNVDASPGGGDYPSRMVFYTTADGASSVSERLRITKDGHVQIAANSSNEARIQFVGSGARMQYGSSSGHIDFYTNSAVRNRFLYNGQGTEFSNQSKVIPTTDNAVDLGQSGNRWDDVFATNGTIQTSDSRLKREVETSVLGINFVKALRPVSYKWIEGKKVPIVDGTDENGENIYRTDGDGNWVYGSRDGARKHWGFIAQEVKQVVDDVSVDFAGWTLADKDDPDSTQSLRYEEFIAPLTKALQEAITKIETLEQRLTDAGL